MISVSELSESSCQIQLVINSTQYTRSTIHHLCCTDVRYEGDKSPLHWACEGGHKDMVEYQLVACCTCSCVYTIHLLQYTPSACIVQM